VLRIIPRFPYVALPFLGSLSPFAPYLPLESLSGHFQTIQLGSFDSIADFRRPRATPSFSPTGFPRRAPPDQPNRNIDTGQNMFPFSSVKLLSPPGIGRLLIKRLSSLPVRKITAFSRRIFEAFEDGSCPHFTSFPMRFSICTC